MINQKTWPNHRLGSDRTAVKAINDQMGIEEGVDLEYGRTKRKFYLAVTNFFTNFFSLYSKRANSEQT